MKGRETNKGRGGRIMKEKERGGVTQVMRRKKNRERPFEKGKRKEKGL